MNWKGHMGLGALIFTLEYIMFVVLDSNFQWMLYQNALIALPTLIIALPVALYASIVPDTDIRTSKAFAVSVVLIVAFIWILVILGRITAILGLVALSLCMVGLLIPSHRGFMHTGAFALLFGIGIGFLFWDWRITVFATVCALSHSLGDR